MMYAVTAKNLSKQFKLPGTKTVKPVIQDVTFSVPVKTKLALVGPNGSGKTTLMKILATLYLPDSGELTIFGYDAMTEADEIRKKISFVSPGLDFHRKLTLKETLEFFAKAQRADISPAMEFIEYMGMTEKLNDRLESFSEGQKSLTRLAIGLMKNAELLLLDEVTATLDVKRKEQVINYLSKYLKDKTMVMVDHDSQVVDRLCERVLILGKQGRLARIMRVQDLVNELPYQYEITMTPLTKLSEEEAKKIWPDFEIFGGKVRFFAKKETELQGIVSRILSYRRFAKFEISGVSLHELSIRATQKQ